MEQETIFHRFVYSLNIFLAKLRFTVTLLALCAARAAIDLLDRYWIIEINLSIGHSYHFSPIANFSENRFNANIFCRWYTSVPMYDIASK